MVSEEEIAMIGLAMLSLFIDFDRLFAALLRRRIKIGRREDKEQRR